MPDFIQGKCQHKEFVPECVTLKEDMRKLQWSNGNPLEARKDLSTLAPKTRLIAAAPELLDMVYICLDFIEAVTCRDGKYCAQHSDECSNDAFDMLDYIKTSLERLGLMKVGEAL